MTGFEKEVYRLIKEEDGITVNKIKLYFSEVHNRLVNPRDIRLAIRNIRKEKLVLSSNKGYYVSRKKDELVKFNKRYFSMIRETVSMIADVNKCSVKEVFNQASLFKG